MDNAHKIESEKAPLTASPTRREAAAGALALLAATLLVYAPALRGEFLWDDQTAIAENPAVIEPGGLRVIWFQPSAHEKEAHYWPVVYSAFWLQHKLWGFDPLGFHLVNVVFHAANALLLWLILRRLKIPGAGFAGTLFALHPVHVESVAWIIELKDTLSAFFYLLALVFFLRFADAQRRRDYCLALACFVLAMWSKTVAATFPAALALLLWRRGTLNRRQTWLALIPFFALAGLLAAFDMRQFALHGDTVALGLSIPERILLSARAILFYFGKLIWPIDPMTFYPRWELRPEAPLAWAPVVAVAGALGALALGVRRWGRAPLAVAGIYVVALSPTLGLVDFNFMRLAWTADRFQYLASAAPLAFFAAAGARFFASPARRRHAGRALGAALVAALGVLTFLRAADYRSMETLCRADLEKNPETWPAHLFLGSYYQRKGETAKAEEHYRQALEIYPRDDRAFSHLAGLWVAQDRYRDAVELIAQGLEHNPESAGLHNNLGTVYFLAGKIEPAIEAMKRAHELNPGDISILLNLGQAHLDSGRPNEALAYYEKILEIEPQHKTARQIVERLRAVEP